MIRYTFGIVGFRKSMFTFKEKNPKGCIMYFRDENNEELFYSQWNNDIQKFNSFKSKSGYIFSVNMYRVIFVEPVYRLLTFDDVERKHCTKEQVGKVDRDDSGNLLPLSEYILYATSDKVLRDRISKEFIETNSTILSQYL